MPSTLLNPSTPEDAHIEARLAGEPIIWLGTVAASRQPHTVPVWFVWHDPVVLMFSQQNTAKLTHLRANTAVSLALDTAASGADVVLGEGTAERPDPAVVRVLLPGFARKYEPLLGGTSIEEWVRTFSEPILVTVNRLIAWTRTADGLEYRSLPPR